MTGALAEKVSGDVDDACARAGIDAIREDIEFAEELYAAAYLCGCELNLPMNEIV